MAQGTKITFSSTEMEAILLPDFFYTKYSALQKIMELLSDTERNLREIIEQHKHLSEHTNISSPKIFRGENYRKLPYMVLDFPRKFSPETVFAFRTMFWWGKEFSFTLHLQNKALDHFRNSISKNISLLEGKGFYFSVYKTPWEYHFETDNYQPLDELLKQPEFLDSLQHTPFIKLSRRLPISEFEKVPELAGGTLKELLEVLSGN